MTITVKELRNHLKEWPDHLIVIVASDAEGNNFHALSELGWANAEQEGYGFEVSSFTPEDDNGNYRQLTLEESNAIVLWP